MRNVALVLTIGQQDVQIFVEYNGKNYFAKPSKDFVREFTESLSNESVKYDVLSLNDYIELGNNKREYEKIDVNGDKKELLFKGWNEKNKNEVVIGIGDSISFTSSIKLVFPMIYNAIESYKKQTDNDETLKQLRILYTSRNRNDEPVGVAEILRPQLCEIFYQKESDDFVVGDNICPYEECNVKSVEHGQTIRPEITNIILRLLLSLRDTYNCESVFVSSNSGIPNIGEAVREISSLVYEKNYIDISSNRGKNLQEIQYCPLERIKTIRKAKKLLAAGNIEGALSLCSVSCVNRRCWAVVRYLNIINSILVNGKDSVDGYDSEFIKKTKVWPLIEKWFLAHDYASTFISLYRIDSYFKREDYVNAIKNIFTFIDIVAWEFVASRVIAKTGRQYIDMENDLIDICGLRQSGIMDDCFKAYDWGKENKHMFSKRVKKVGSATNSKEYLPLDLFIIYLKNTNIDELRNMLSNNTKLREARNTSTHSTIVYGKIVESIEELTQKGLVTKDNYGILSFYQTGFIRNLINSLAGKHKNNDLSLYNELDNAYKQFYELIMEDLNDLVFMS